MRLRKYVPSKHIKSIYPHLSPAIFLISWNTKEFDWMSVLICTVFPAKDIYFEFRFTPEQYFKFERPFLMKYLCSKRFISNIVLS